MEPFCFLNGAVLPLKDARISVLDLGVLRGFGVYDGLTAFSGEPFRFDDHWERFVAAAAALGLSIPHVKEEIRSAMRTIIAHNAPGKRANLRIVLTGGAAEKGIEYVPGRETLFITAEPAAPLPAALYERGGSLMLHEHDRFMPEIKTTHYLTAVSLQKKRAAAGATEIVYTSGGRVLEGATSNIFVVKGDAIATPDADILKGVTRKIVLELAVGTYPAKERAVSIDELLGADEAFITGSFKDIVPIVSVDGRTVGSGAPGPVVRDLMRRFAQYAAAS